MNNQTRKKAILHEKKVHRKYLLLKNYINVLVLVLPENF